MRFPTLLVAVAALAAAAGAQSAAQVKAYGNAFAAAKKTFAARPKDPKARQGFVAAGDRFATSTMMSPDLDRKVKYRDALRIYREVLKVDPTNHEAKSNSDLIVSIYKSMHRPVPN